MNPDLKKLHTMLIAQVSSLSSQIGQTGDREKVTVLIQEIHEINHRVNLIGTLLFHKATAKISKKMEALAEAEAELKSAIKTLDDLAAFLKKATAFLKIVDQIIDLAKAA